MDELFENTTYRIFELFIEYPDKNFSIRGVARNLKMSHATVITHVASLEDNGFIKKNEETLYPTYFANTQNKKYVFYKKNHILEKLLSSGIIEHIQKKCLPSTIILFGSCAKGTFTEKSDIDIFVESEESLLDLTLFEKRLCRKINVLFEKKLLNLSKELKNNIINGTILYGFIR